MMCEEQYHFGDVSEAPALFGNSLLPLLCVINTLVSERCWQGTRPWGGGVTSPAAWEAMGGLRFRSGKHHFVV